MSRPVTQPPCAAGPRHVLGARARVQCRQKMTHAGARAANGPRAATQVASRVNSRRVDFTSVKIRSHHMNSPETFRSLQPTGLGPTVPSVVGGEAAPRNHRSRTEAWLRPLLPRPLPPAWGRGENWGEAEIPATKGRPGGWGSCTVFHDLSARPDGWPGEMKPVTRQPQSEAMPPCDKHIDL